MKTVLLVMLCAMVAGCAAPRPSSTASVSPAPSRTAPAAATATQGLIADAPYRLSILSARGSPGPTIAISSAADCGPLPSDWLRQVCALTLPSHWQAIISETDLFNDPTTGAGSPTWWAALARAVIDGDTSLCFDVSMRMWISIGSSPGVAPEPGSTPSPIHPIGACFEFLRSTAAKGLFQINDQGSGNPSGIVVLEVDSNAVAKAAAGTPPAFDPYVVCDVRSLTRDVCNQLIAAVTSALGSRQTQVQDMDVRGVPAECLSATASCPTPFVPGFVGGVVAGPLYNSRFAFNVTSVGGQLEVTEVPYEP